MYEEQTFEEIMTRMLSNVDDKFDKREGSVIYDALAPAALELANYYVALDMVMDEMFADTASYYYLIKRAAEKGLFPKEETHAILKMEVTPAGAAITVGDRFNLNELNYTVVRAEEDVAGVYQVECETAGTVGNQQIGLLLPLETSNALNDLEVAELTEVLVPGEEEEDVEDFRQRYFDSFNRKAFGGNKTDYKEKVNAIDGVGACKIKRSWEDGYAPVSMIPDSTAQSWFEQQSVATVGSAVYTWLSIIYNAAIKKLLTTGGTVRVMIITSEFKAPSSTLVQTVQETLDPTNAPGEGDGITPIGHVVNVVGVSNAVVNFEFTIVYKYNYSFAALEEKIAETIDSYLSELRKDWANNDNIIIRINQIETRLLQLDGIVDITGTLINGQNENLILGEEEIPVRGDVVG